MSLFDEVKKRPMIQCLTCPNRDYDWQDGGGAFCASCIEAGWADAYERALLHRDIGEVEKELRDIRVEIASLEKRADAWEESISELRVTWQDNEARSNSDRALQARGDVRRLKKRLVRPEAWLVRAKAVLP